MAMVFCQILKACYNCVENFLGGIILEVKNKIAQEIKKAAQSAVDEKIFACNDLNFFDKYFEHRDRQKC